MKRTPVRRWLLVLALLAGCVSAPSPPAEETTVGVDTARLMADLRALAADSMEGRRAGTAGAERARRYLARELAAAGLRSFPGGLERPFTFAGPGGEVRGVNLVGYVEGTSGDAGPVMVVTAHYDHLGVVDGAIHNGADDNASGAAALLEITRHFTAHPPEHRIVIAALDAEEMGLRGARAFLRDPPVPVERIALNVNLDMVGRNDRGELFAAGIHHNPALRPPLQQAAAGAPITLRFGHDSPSLPASDDWTQQSDHGVFHSAGIPFVYFGVEDHPDYHRPTDDAERIQPRFYAGAVETVIRAIRELDAELEAIAAGRGG